MKRRSAILAGAMGLILGAAGPAPADDTELFIATADPLITGSQPNILFIIDTSGSMNTEVVTQEDWDSDREWSGCFEGTGVYFSTTNSKPECTSNDWFEKEQNFCQDSWGPLAGVGAYSGSVKAWRDARERWINLNGERKSRPVDCENDAGIHGDGSSGRLWAANGPTGPWEDAPDLQPAWNQQYFLWDGNWLNWNASGGSVTKQRSEIVKEVANQLLDNIDGVNVGLMRFHREEGGPVLQAIEDIGTSRAAMKTAIDSLPASGYTPLSETLYEAGQYYAGRNVDYGNVEEPRSVAASRLGNDITSNTYRAPVNAACQKNYIVLLSDGAPTRDVSAQSKIESLPGFSTLVGPSCDGGTGDGVCLDDMAEYLHKYDLDSTLPGAQTVTTYTIGFAVDLPLLRSTAERGGGQYYLADDTSSLAGVMTEIVLSILDDAATFTSPSVPINAFNRSQNMNDVFVSVFGASGTMHWPGNLKKYALSGGRLVGQNGQPAIDPATGFFTEDAWSFWSPSVDGNRVEAGGAASQLPDPASRRVFTDISGAPLTAANNAIVVGNTALTATMLGAPAAERDTVIQWFRGLDVFDDDDDGVSTDTRNVMGDPLHVRPTTVIYGGTQEDPDLVVFTATNDGQFHAVDADDGRELWTYTPSRLLGRIYELYRDDPTATKRYGLDGNIRAHIVNNDGRPGITGAERVILVFGQRRGGDSIFALDVTDRNAPVRLWEINNGTPGFEDLGQTWSTPVVADVNVAGTRKTVAMFGGGYDSGQDNSGYRVDNVGNAVFFVDLLTGAKVWSAGENATDHDLVLPKMQHSIPAPLAVLDINQDGLADRMYVGDMGGRVWRFDIVNGGAGMDLVEGGVIASLGAAHLPSPRPASEIRRFYAAPDIVPVVSRDRYFLTINLGSGYRAHPLDATTNDEFFSIRDFDVLGVIDTEDYPATPLTRSGLLDITNDTNPTLLPTDNGWRLRMARAGGEKILNKSTTFQNSVFFTSFTPGARANACVASNGLNRLYRVDIRDGSPLTNLDGSVDGPDDLLTAEDRYTNLQQGGIAPEVVFVFPPDRTDEPVVCIGVECPPVSIDSKLVRTFWTQDGT
jgi:type IV pilus assembly protein PilY1